MSRALGANGTPYTRHEVIGRGSYGIVYKGVHNVSRAAVAIKVLNLDTAEDEVADIQKEIVLLQSLKAGDAQNVVKYHASFLNGTRLWIIMDYCEGGSIRTLMKSGRIEEKYIVVIIREVLAALTYIHRAGIIHRDVKAANILVTNEGRVQLCDFGVAAQLAVNHFKRNTFVGTPYWMAPEVISEGLTYNFKADIWSLGITIYEIAMGNPPYADQEPMRAIFLIPRSTPPRLEGPNFSPQLKEFVSACLVERPEDRLSAPDLAKTKCIKNSAKTPTLVIRDLIGRYEAWRKSGGVRKSLAMGGDLDVDDEFDGQFGLDDDSGNGREGWDFGTARRSSRNRSFQPTWEQSADATEDLLRTIRPAGQSQSVDRSAEGSHVTPNSASATSRYEHPLMKLFGDHKAASGVPLQSLGPAMSDSQGNNRSGFHQTSLGSEAQVSSQEAVSIEMPALNATSIPMIPLAPAISTSASASTIPTNGIVYRAEPGDSVAGGSNHRAPGPTPSRQVSFDSYGGQDTGLYSSGSSQQTVTLADETPPPSSPTLNIARSSGPSPPKSFTRAPSPNRSRTSSPTRIPILSPPASPSRAMPSASHSTNLSSSSGVNLLPRTGFNASLGAHLHLNGSTQSLPDILPRPSISGASRERSTSSSAVPQLPKHVKKPSNLVLQVPPLDSSDTSRLPLSPSRLPPPSSGLSVPPAGYVPTPLFQRTNAPDPNAPDISTSKTITELPHMASLNLEVLNDSSHEAVVSELSRVVGEMLQQLMHIEDGLTSMSTT